MAISSSTFLPIWEGEACKKELGHPKKELMDDFFFLTKGEINPTSSNVTFLFFLSFLIDSAIGWAIEVLEEVLETRILVEMEVSTSNIAIKIGAGIAIFKEPNNGGIKETTME